MTKDYDQAYRVLGLEPGTPLADIEDEWKLLAAAYHPDKFSGRLQEKALRRLQHINNARDLLKSYWDTHGTAPPSKGASAQGQRRQEREQDPPKSETEKAHSKHTNAQSHEEHAYSNPRQAESATNVVPFGPPVFQKGPVHHFFDMMERLDQGEYKNLVAFVGAVAILLVASLPVVLVNNLGYQGQLFSEDPGLGLVLWTAATITLWIFGISEFKLYKILQNPFCEHIELPAEVALLRVHETLSDFEPSLSKFEFSENVEVSNIVSAVCKTEFEAKAAGFATTTYGVQINVRILPDPNGEKSTACYWFEAEKRFWKSPLLDFVQKVDRALSRALLD